MRSAVGNSRRNRWQIQHLKPVSSADFGPPAPHTSIRAPNFRITRGRKTFGVVSALYLPLLTINMWSFFSRTLERQNRPFVDYLALSATIVSMRLGQA